MYEAYLVQDLDKILSCECAVMVHLETFQVFDCGYILAIKLPRANMCPHSRLLARRTLELGMNGEFGQWTLCCWKGQTGQSFEY